MLISWKSQEIATRRILISWKSQEIATRRVRGWEEPSRAGEGTSHRRIRHAMLDSIREAGRLARTHAKRWSSSSQLSLSPASRVMHGLNSGGSSSSIDTDSDEQPADPITAAARISLQRPERLFRRGVSLSGVAMIEVLQSRYRCHNRASRSPSPSTSPRSTPSAELPRAWPLSAKPPGDPPCEPPWLSHRREPPALNRGALDHGRTRAPIRALTRTRPRSADRLRGKDVTSTEAWRSDAVRTWRRGNIAFDSRGVTTFVDLGRSTGVLLDPASTNEPDPLSL